MNGVQTAQTAAQAAQALDAYINANPDLARYRGMIVPKNTGRNRAFTRIDLHLEQEIPTFIGRSRIAVFADINNLPTSSTRTGVACASSTSRTAPRQSRCNA